MAVDIKTAHQHLWKYCRGQGYAGYDPYDGLNSRMFQATPLRHSRAARLAWIQLHKRSPINFRSLVGVPRERNAKAIALFAMAALADFRRHPTAENEIEARELLDDLIWMSLKGFKGACWGYNFDWQSRSFFVPRGTPTIVPTAFAARALCETQRTAPQRPFPPRVNLAVADDAEVLCMHTANTPGQDAHQFQLLQIQIIDGQCLKILSMQPVNRRRFLQ